MTLYIFFPKTGDGRVNEFAGIVTQHLIWVREHNRIEEQLWHLNPHWSGERLFQETRKIIIAIWQYVIYKEYLPVILGRETMDVYRLTLVEDGFWNGRHDRMEKKRIAPKY
jgi:peroxidase